MGLWTPQEISPAIWLDFSDSATVSVVNVSGVDRIQTVNDKSGNAAHFSAASTFSRPIKTPSYQNGLDVARFNGGSSHYMVGNAASLQLFRDVPGITAMAFVIPNSPATGSHVFAISRGTDIQVRANMLFDNYLKAQGRRLDADAAQNAELTATASLPSAREFSWLHLLGGAYVFSGVYDYQNTDLSVGINGTYAVNDTFHTTGNTSDTASNQISIGSWANASGSYVSAFIGEIVFVASALSAANLQKMEGYFAHKWGVPFVLPDSHPYKLFPPGVNLVSGTVLDRDGNPAARAVRIYNRDTGVLIGSVTSDAVTGQYSMTVNAADEFSVVAIADESAIFNDQITRVLPL